MIAHLHFYNLHFLSDLILHYKLASGRIRRLVTLSQAVRHSVESVLRRPW